MIMMTRTGQTPVLIWGRISFFQQRQFRPRFFTRSRISSKLFLPRWRACLGTPRSVRPGGCPPVVRERLQNSVFPQTGDVQHLSAPFPPPVSPLLPPEAHEQRADAVLVEVGVGRHDVAPLIEHDPPDLVTALAVAGNDAQEPVPAPLDHHPAHHAVLLVVVTVEIPQGEGDASRPAWEGRRCTTSPCDRGPWSSSGTTAPPRAST